MSDRLRYCCRCPDVPDEGIGPEEADYEVKGWIIWSEKKTPFHAYLCKGHLMILNEDYECNLRIMRTLSRS